jgi:hypothetical protein
MRKKIVKTGICGLLILISWIAGIFEAFSEDDLISFVNGDKLHGKVIAVDPVKGVALKNQFIEQTTAFPVDSIVKIVFAETEQPPVSGKYPCIIRMVNRDELECSLVSLDESSVVVSAPFSENLTIPRKRIDSINPISPNPAIIYKGPTGTEGWTISSSPVEDEKEGKWRYVNGSFIATGAGSLARDLKLPDMATIEFDIAWKNYMSVAVALYASTLQPILLSKKDDPDVPDFGSFYSLQINFNTANLMLIKKGIPLNSMGMAFIPNMEAKTSAHIMIRVSKPQKMILLYVDGILVKQWQEQGEFGGSGTCVRFVNQLSTPIKISNIVVSQWDGRIEIPITRVDNSKSDFINMINNDVINGTVKEFKNGKFIVQTPFGTVDVPFERVSHMHFSMIGREPAIRTQGEIPVVFQRQGKLSLKPEKWDGDKLIAVNPNFGRIALPLSMIKVINFKPDYVLFTF